MSNNFLMGGSTPNTTENMAKLPKEAISQTGAIMKGQIAAIPNKIAYKKHHRKKTGYAVKDEVLLYKLSDAGLLSKLHGVSGPAPRTWYFDRDKDVREVIEQFNAENKASFSIDKDGNANLSGGTLSMEAAGLTIDENGMHFMAENEVFIPTLADEDELHNAVSDVNKQMVELKKTDNNLQKMAAWMKADVEEVGTQYKTISMRVHKD